MRPVKVEFQAFGPYAGYEAVDFEAVSSKGLFLICGKTGIGKTMILDAMTFALYGKSSGHGRDDFEAMRCTKADFDKATFVKFEFENSGEYYLFERRLERRRKNLSASYNVMRKDEDGVFRVLLENAREKALNEMAVEIIGLEYEQFRQVIVLPQGQFEKLLTSNSDEKEKILTSIFGEEKWQAIAERLYNEAACRKDQLKERKDKIFYSLREEQCDSMSQLRLLISHKKKSLEELEGEYSEAAYDRVIKEQQEILAIAKRFGDLHRAENRVAELGGRASERAAGEKRIADAVRAGRVRAFMEAAGESAEILNLRKREEAAIRSNADKAGEALERAAERLRAHVADEENVERKKTLKIQYEGKRKDYEGIDDVRKELEDKRAEESKAKSEEAAAEDKYGRYAGRIVKLQGEYEGLRKEHGSLLERYLAGITGELAASLTEGRPCPVCGSTTHPCKAAVADNSITRAMVDKGKRAADGKYKELQDAMGEQEQAKKAYEEKRAAAEAGHSKVVAALSKLEGMKQNLVEGIASLTELNSATTALDDEIKAYAEKKAELEKAEKTAKDAFTEARARIEPAKRETEAADAKLREAKKAVDEELKSNQFASEEEARELFLEEEDIERLKKQIADYDANVKAAGEALEQLRAELKGKAEPDEEECRRKLEEASEAKSVYAQRRGVLGAEIARLSEKAGNLEAEGEGIEEKIREAEEDFAFAKKLRGDSGTGLQRYVLGIMFSSVIAAANRMLELVHGGRYRLYRSDEKAQGTNKRGLELKVFDKNSGDHEGRFVSTLSGGEKFLASLALSIGMSTVAKKSGIRIEALFIDEGFGSLDEDSIGDAMNILSSIQQANGLVGIISHVRLLQERIPTKLMVEETEAGSHIVQTIG